MKILDVVWEIDRVSPNFVLSRDTDHPRLFSEGLRKLSAMRVFLLMMFDDYNFLTLKSKFEGVFG